MGRKKVSMSEKIRNYIKANPGAKPQEVANSLGVKTSLVYAIKYKDGKKPKPKAKAKSGITFYSPVIEMIEPLPDVVNNPPHYTDGGIEVIDFLQAKLTKEEFIGYLKGNALKYGSRMGKKDSPATDAGKMAWYATKLRDTLATV